MPNCSASVNASSAVTARSRGDVRGGRRLDREGPLDARSRPARAALERTGGTTEPWASRQDRGRRARRPRAAAREVQDGAAAAAQLQVALPRVQVAPELRIDVRLGAAVRGVVRGLEDRDRLRADDPSARPRALSDLA